MSWECTFRHVSIDLIRPGDTVFHNDKLMTVCRSDIRLDADMGITLFGDSYRLGTKPVVLAIPVHARPELVLSAEC